MALNAILAFTYPFCAILIEIKKYSFSLLLYLSTFKLHVISALDMIWYLWIHAQKFILSFLKMLVSVLGRNKFFKNIYGMCSFPTPQIWLFWPCIQNWSLFGATLDIFIFSMQICIMQDINERWWSQNVRDEEAVTL